ncbi:DEAD/DEAH box helicase [Derxia lacustris]|uniref:DEAD/DEAH box helicase n=1 Tax=Derxia lacustris TaxID=764842 RepID=UPI000A175A87|nr:DEAD/DEAH box helicase [Derxia lacustris]
MSFDTLGLHPALLKAVQALGFSDPTPVQIQTIPTAMTGVDLMVSSSTGSGKTAAFMLPALHAIAEAGKPEGRDRPEPREDSRRFDDRRGGPDRRPAPRESRNFKVQTPRILVMAPTRELAQQVAQATFELTSELRWLRIATIVGGVPYGRQLQQLRGHLDIVIGTPGRLLDHIRNGKLDLSNVKTLVLDEADRMLDMGFIDDIREVADATPADRQTLLFSATFAGPVARLAEGLMREPRRIELANHRDVHTDISQRLHWADDIEHKNALLDHLLRGVDVQQAIVFTSTQRDADWLAERLEDDGHAAAALHGGMPQGQRNRTLTKLREGRLRVLVATDVAARGIDVPTISHVINYGLPMTAEDYVHRIGRTGRAGRSGLAVTIVEHRDAGAIRRIERFTSQPIPVETIVGLEPKRQPRPMNGKPGGPSRPGSGPRKPGSGGRPGYGAKPSGPRREGHPSADRREGSFRPRRAD